MAHNWLLYIAAFASAFGISLLTTPFAKKFSIKVGAIDYPKKRGMHTEPIPRMGGLAIIIGFLGTLAIITPFMPEFRTTQFIGFVIGSIIIAGAGMLDDIYNLKPKTKLAFQIVAALVVMFSGTKITFVTWPILTHFDALSWPITLFWIIGVTNAVNIIDGLDGLAAGVSGISAVCLTILCILTPNQQAVVLAATISGSCLGFLPRNFSPAEVFMGDTGALFLGYVLAVSSIIGVYKSYAVLSIVMVVLALALPILDTLFAMLRRLLRGKPIMQADRGHLHHRLIDAGYSQRSAVVILYALSLLSGMVAVLIALKDIKAVIIVAVFVIIFYLVIYVYRKRTH